MSDLWELICHHTYRGIPGVVADLSPSGAGHGRAFGLAPGDFLADGASMQSGAVRCHNAGGSVRVATTADPWSSIVGIKGEARVRREVGAIGFIVDSDSFQFHVRSDALVAWFSSFPLQYAEISTGADWVGPQPYKVPLGTWVTLGFLHDGFGTMELYADGAVVARRHSALAPVNAPRPNGLSIGNAHSLQVALGGQIDDLKIWRLNPRRFDENFNARPMDDATAACWVRLRRELVEALRRHPECAGRIGAAIDAILRGLVRDAEAKGAETRERLAQASRDYSDLWQAGKVGGPEMALVFEDLITWLRLVGIPIEGNAAIAQLNDSECLKKILAEISTPDCDKQALQLVSSIADAFRSRSPRPAART